MDNQEFFYRAKLALQEYWWQDDEPKVASVSRELSALKPWRKRIQDDELLIRALEAYRGSPLCLLWAHKRGNNHVLNRLLAKARQHRETEGTHVSEGLKEFAENILQQDPS